MLFNSNSYSSKILIQRKCVVEDKFVTSYNLILDCVTLFLTYWDYQCNVFTAF